VREYAVKWESWTSIKGLIKEKFTSIYYTGSSGVASVAQLVSGFIIIKYVDPSELGIWKSVQILTVYSFFILFGINNGLNRELPFLLGQDKLELAKNSAGVALFINILTSCLILFVGLITVISISNMINNKVLLAALTIIPYIIINHYNNYIGVTYRSRNSFNTLSNIKLVESALMLLTVLFVVFYGYKGMLLRALAMLFAVTFFMHIYRPVKVSPIWNKNILVNLYKTGIPIFIVDYIKNICQTVAPLIVLKKSGFEMVGFFSFGMMVFTTLSVIPISINQYAYPKFCYLFGKYNKPVELWKSSVRYLVFCLLMLLPIMVFCMLFINYFVLNYFPKYYGGVPSAKIFILASFFNSIAIMSSVLLGLKCFKLFMFHQITFSIMLFIFPSVFVSVFSNSTIGASFGILLANIFNFGIVLYIVYISTHNLEIVNE